MGSILTIYNFTLKEEKNKGLHLNIYKGKVVLLFLSVVHNFPINTLSYLNPKDFAYLSIDKRINMPFFHWIKGEVDDIGSCFIKKSVQSVLVNRWGEITQVFYAGDSPSYIIKEIENQF